MHRINARQPGQDWLIPTALSLIGADGIEMKVQYPQGERKSYAFADTPIAIYAGKVTLQARLTTRAVTSGTKPVLQLTYQACTDSSCLRPQSVMLPVKFTGLDK